MRVLDVGCGTGDLTLRLHEETRARETLGIDPSEKMLAEARARAAPGLRFERGAAEDLDPGGGWDLVFSNAALHWVPDHEGLFGRLAQWLALRGQVAIQLPANQDHPSTRVAAVAALEEPFRSRLAGWSLPDPRLSPEGYAVLLHRLGFDRQHVRMQVYGHLLPSREDVVEWVRGALLVDYRARLGEELFPAFVARYRELLFARVPDDRPFFFTFRRLLLWGSRP